MCRSLVTTTKVTIVRRTSNCVRGDTSSIGYSCSSDPWVCLSFVIASIAAWRDSTSCKLLEMSEARCAPLPRTQPLLRILMSSPSSHPPKIRSPRPKVAMPRCFRLSLKCKTIDSRARSLQAHMSGYRMSDYWHCTEQCQEKV